MIRDIEVKKFLVKFFPKCDEPIISIYGFLILVLLIFNKNFQNMLLTLGNNQFENIFFVILFIGGTIFSAFSVFFKRKRTKNEKFFILCYIVMVNLFIMGCLLGNTASDKNNSFIFNLPIYFNIIYLIIVVITLKIGFDDQELKNLLSDNISAKKTDKNEVILMVATALILFALFNFLLKYNEFYAFSYVIFIITIILHILHHVRRILPT
jgi:hypothetical protein